MPRDVTIYFSISHSLSLSFIYLYSSLRHIDFIGQLFPRCNIRVMRFFEFLFQHFQLIRAKRRSVSSQFSFLIGLDIVAFDSLIITADVTNGNTVIRTSIVDFDKMFVVVVMEVCFVYCESFFCCLTNQ